MALNEIPDVAKAAAQIYELRNVDFSKVSFRKMKAVLLNEFGILPRCDGTVHEGTYLIRARVNPSNEHISSERDLSYRPDEWNIRSYGRAHAPLRSIFYGVMLTEGADQAIETVLSEISELYRKPSSNKTEDSTELYFTFGIWKVTQPFGVAQMLFSRQFIKELSWVREGYKHFIDSFSSKQTQDEVETIKLLMQFYAEEFSKSGITDEQEYMISAAYTQAILEITDLQGITYPSVRRDGHGVNIALSPHIIDTHATLEEVHYCHLMLNAEEKVCTPMKKVVGFGPLNSTFSWEPHV